MIADPNAIQAQPLPNGMPPGIMGSDEIIGHVRNAFDSMPPEAQSAVSHLHGILGLKPPATAASSAPESPATPSIASSPSIPPATPPVASGGDSAVPGMVGVNAGMLAAPPMPSSSVQALPSPPPQAGVSGNGEIADLNRANPNPVAPVPAAGNRSSLSTELQTMRDKGAGWHSIHNPFLKAAASVGNVLASGLFPQFGQFIGGTDAKHFRDVQEKEAEVADEQGQRKAADEAAMSAANQKHLTAESDELQHRAGREDAQAKLLENNPNWEESKELTVDPEHPDKGPQVTWISKKDPTQKLYVGTAAAKPVETKAPTNDLEAWLQAPEHKGQPIEKLLGDYWTKKAEASGQEKSKPLTPDTAKTLNAASNSIAPKYGLPENPFHDGMSNAEVAHVQGLLNSVIQRNQGAQNITINQGKADAARANIPAALESVNPKFIQHAVGDYSKIADEYQNTLEANRDMQTALDEAKKGNKLAYAYDPVLGVLTINAAHGTKRINMHEIAAYAGAGSLVDKITGFFGKQVSGASIPADVLKDMSEFHQALANNAIKKYNAKIDRVNSAYGSNYPHRTDDSDSVDKLKAFADEHFGGDIAKAQAEVDAQRKRKAGK